MISRRRWSAGVGVVALGWILGGCSVSSLLEPSREEVLDRILPSAVQIVVEQKDGRRLRAGSGVVLASRGGEPMAECFVLTSGHTLKNVAGRHEVYVVFGRSRGKAKKVGAQILAQRDTSNLDLALLRAEAPSCVAAKVGGPPLLGDSVWVVGFPWGRHMTLASGIVSQINLDDETDRETASRLMVDASVSYGSSGGGVYEAKGGALIGIVEGYSTARVSPEGGNSTWYIDVPVPGQTFVTPISDVRRFLSETGYTSLVDGSAAPPEISGASASPPR